MSFSDQSVLPARPRAAASNSVPICRVRISISGKAGVDVFENQFIRPLRSNRGGAHFILGVLKEDRAAGDRSLRFRQFVAGNRRDLQPALLQPFARPRKMIRINQRLSDPEGIGRKWLGGIDGHLIDTRE